MRLTNLQISGLKGTAVAADIPSLLFLHGRNGAGKTAWFDGLTLLVNGWHPALTHTADGVMRLSDGDAIHVAGTFDHAGRTIKVSRSWTRREITRGKRIGQFVIETDVRYITDEEELTGEAAKARIAETLGPPGMLGLHDLMDSSDAQRRRMLLDAGASLVDLSPDQIREMLETRAILEQVRAWDGAVSVAEWIEDEYQHARDKASEARKRARSTQEAVEALSAIEDPVDPADVGKKRAHVAQLREHLTTAREQWSAEQERRKGDLDQAREQREAHRRATRGLEDITAEERKIREVTTDDTEIERLRGEIDGLDTGFDGIPDAEQGVEQARERADRAQATMMETTREAVTAAGDVERAAAEQKRKAQEPIQQSKESQRAEASIYSAQGGVDEATELRDSVAKRIEDSFECPTCPTCGQGMTISTLDALGDGIDTALDRLARMKEKAVPIFAADKTSKKERDQRIKASIAAAMEATEHRRGLATEYNTAMDRHRNAIFAVDAAEQAHRALRAKRDDLARQLAALERTTNVGPRLAELDERRRTLQTTVDRGTADPDAIQTDSDRRRDEVDQQLHQRRTALAEEEGHLRDAEDRLAAEKHAANLRVQLHDAESDLAEALRVEGEIGPKGMMGEMVRQLLAPFLDAVHRSLDGLDLGTFEVRLVDKRGNPVFWLGVVRDDHFAPIESLSSGEALVVSSAAVLGLAKLAGRKWRPLLLDHTERVDTERRRTLLRHLSEMVDDGEADQVIAAGCPDEAPTGAWEVVGV